jgi:hypothetical protein
VFGVTLNQVFFVVGLSRTSVAHAAIIIGLTPMLVLILACLRGLERMTAPQSRGHGHRAGRRGGAESVRAGVRHEAPPGSAISSFSWPALCFAIFTVSGKEATAAVQLRHGEHVRLRGRRAGAGAGDVLWEASRHALAHVSAAAWLSMLYMALFPSVLAYLIYYHALARISASRVSAFSYLQPVFATAMGVAILGERLGASVIAGGVVILCGVWLAERG